MGAKDRTSQTGGAINKEYIDSSEGKTTTCSESVGVPTRKDCTVHSLLPRAIRGKLEKVCKLLKEKKTPDKPVTVEELEKKVSFGWKTKIKICYWKQKQKRNDRREEIALG